MSRAIRRRRLMLGCAAVALLVAACATVEQPTEPISPETLTTGAELYQASCAECHGSDLRGTDSGPSHLSQVYEAGHHADIAFSLAVQNGSRAHHWNFGDMPAIEGLNDEDVRAITAYVRSVQDEQGFEPYPP